MLLGWSHFPALGSRSSIFSLFMSVTSKRRSNMDETICWQLFSVMDEGGKGSDTVAIQYMTTVKVSHVNSMSTFVRHVSQKCFLTFSVGNWLNFSLNMFQRYCSRFFFIVMKILNLFFSYWTTDKKEVESLHYILVTLIPWMSIERRLDWMFISRGNKWVCSPLKQILLRPQTSPCTCFLLFHVFHHFHGAAVVDCLYVCVRTAAALRVLVKQNLHME